MVRRLPASAVLALAALTLGRTAGAQHAAPPAGRVLAERVRVEGSPASGRTSASPAGHRPLTRATHAIPLRGDDTHLIVHGTLNGVLSGPMLVDTGASYCVLTRAAARLIGLTLVARSTVPVATANGQVVADLLQLDSVEIEDASLRRVDAVVMDAVDPPLIGIIGLSFLNHFRYSVDHAQGMIQLER